MKNIRLKLTILSLVAACLMFVFGCSKLTAENYNRLKVGMDYKEVVEVFGEAEECSSAIGIKKCTWGDERKFIKVNFAGDKVVLFSKRGLK